MKREDIIPVAAEILIGCIVLCTLSGLVVYTHDLSDRVDRLEQEQTSDYKELKTDVVGITDRLSRLEVATDTDAEEAREDVSEPQEDTEELAVDTEDPTEAESQEEASEELEYAGIFELTAYTWTGNTCANGNYPTAGYTVASNYFPLGTRIYIEGMGEYTVEDTGGMATNVIDVYMEGSDNCKQFGRRQAGVYIVK